MKLLLPLLSIILWNWICGRPPFYQGQQGLHDDNLNKTRCMENSTANPFASFEGVSDMYNNCRNILSVNVSESSFEKHIGGNNPFHDFMQGTVFCDPLYGTRCCIKEQTYSTLNIIIYANFSGVTPVFIKYWPQTLFVTKNLYLKQKIYSKTLCQVNLTSSLLCCGSPYLWSDNTQEPTLRQGPPFTYYVTASSLNRPPLSKISPVFDLQIHPWCGATSPVHPSTKVVSIGGQGTVSYGFRHCPTNGQCDRYSYESY
ncbi:hypothetical protein [Vombatid gammaherpesvirus 1]|uniref:Uncharacterized protein n=1 Tax=Vombatid gammaherpesvirus 1 TaxID=2052651 RepID=A0A3S8D7J4_9GAMA|nr:hypothetical protein KM710_gp04 [Vombatid gammaherpesvirus 1]AZB49109.1 hypothetical protein [Vombatid gammaherpesvirus 1]